MLFILVIDKNTCACYELLKAKTLIGLIFHINSENCVAYLFRMCLFAVDVVENNLEHVKQVLLHFSSCSMNVF